MTLKEQIRMRYKPQGGRLAYQIKYKGSPYSNDVSGVKYDELSCEPNYRGYCACLDSKLLGKEANNNKWLLICDLR